MALSEIKSSHIGRLPVACPSGVEVRFQDRRLTIKGKNGELSLDVHELVQLRQEGAELRFSPADGSTEARALTGTMRALAANMVTGVSEGYERALELVGVGYRVNVQGRRVELALGFSHPISYPLPDGIEASTEGATTLILKGTDKQLLGQVASEIRRFRPPEPYKGKGVRYRGEYVRKKEGKKK
ncbi:MAG: 50S ribosomal protein L6 [Gammaproteobacteria bacterium AqS3]|nr:50S ribosomal protein L6 [Gammaproteobacteria bacterium AqS3]